MGKLLDKLRTPRPAGDDSGRLLEALRKAQAERDAARAAREATPEANGAAVLAEDPPVVPVDEPLAVPADESQVVPVPDLDPEAMTAVAAEAAVEFESDAEDDRRQRAIIAVLIAAAVACAVLAWTGLGVD